LSCRSTYYYASQAEAELELREAMEAIALEFARNGSDVSRQNCVARLQSIASMFNG